MLLQLVTSSDAYYPRDNSIQLCNTVGNGHYHNALNNRIYLARIADILRHTGNT